MLFPPEGQANSLIAPSSLSLDQIEEVEKLTARWLFHALLDFGRDAFNIFALSPDEVKDVAEDVTREVLDRLPGYNLPERVYGNVDYKRARYIFLPNYAVRQALFSDSKAEKSNTTATIQMSQTSLEVRQVRAGGVITAPGFLKAIWEHDGKEYLTTTAIIHYKYEDVGTEHKLRVATLACIPLVQDQAIDHALAREPRQHVPRAVGRAVVHADDLEVQLPIERAHTRHRCLDRRVFVVDRHHDAELHDSVTP